MREVIVTSYLFPDATFSWERLERIKEAVGGKERLVIDLSCRRRGDKWFVAMDRWQRITDMEVNEGMSCLAMVVGVREVLTGGRNDQEAGGSLR